MRKFLFIPGLGVQVIRYIRRLRMMSFLSLGGFRIMRVTSLILARECIMQISRMAVALLSLSRCLKLRKKVQNSHL